MEIANITKIAPDEFVNLERDLTKHKTLRQVLSWANGKPKSDFTTQIVAEVITQDEFTHDIIIPYKNLFLVYDTT